MSSLARSRSACPPRNRFGPIAGCVLPGSRWNSAQTGVKLVGDLRVGKALCHGKHHLFLSIGERYHWLGFASGTRGVGETGQQARSLLNQRMLSRYTATCGTAHLARTLKKVWDR